MWQEGSVVGGMCAEVVNVPSRCGSKEAFHTLRKSGQSSNCRPTSGRELTRINLSHTIILAVRVTPSVRVQLNLI